MSEVHPIDQTLDSLEEAVAGLTSSTNIDALRYIHSLGRTPGRSRHAAESAKVIADLCNSAEAQLMGSIEFLESEQDDAAQSCLGHALVHLEKIAETVAAVMSKTQPAPVAEFRNSKV